MINASYWRTTVFENPIWALCKQNIISTSSHSVLTDVYNTGNGCSSCSTFQAWIFNSLILKLRLFNRELFNLELFNHELFNCEYFNPLGLQVSVEKSGVEMFGDFSLHDHTSLFRIISILLALFDTNDILDWFFLTFYFIL